MKNIRRLSLGATLAGSTLLSLITWAPTAPAGPGAVVDAVRAFTKAIDDGDVAYLRSAMSDEGPGFHDLAFDGKPIEARTLAGFADAWQASIERRGLEDVTHDIKRIVADCPSGNCSYAYIEFDRLIGAGKTRRVPMRGTVLLKYSDGKRAFEIFHWNISRTDGKAWPAQRSK